MAGVVYHLSILSGMRNKSAGESCKIENCFFFLLEKCVGYGIGRTLSATWSDSGVEWGDRTRGGDQSNDGGVRRGPSQSHIFRIDVLRQFYPNTAYEKI